MSESNGKGIIKIGRKGIKKFAFGDNEADVFEVDIVEVWYKWIALDNSFRPEEEDANGERNIPYERMDEFHREAVNFVTTVSGGKALDITRAEAREFISRIRDEYNDLADFFQPKSRQKQDSPGTLETEVRFSEQGN